MGKQLVRSFPIIQIGERSCEFVAFLGKCPLVVDDRFLVWFVFGFVLSAGKLTLGGNR